MSLSLVPTEAGYVDVRLNNARIVRVERVFDGQPDSFDGVLIGAENQNKLYLVIHDLLIVNGVTMVDAADITSEVDAQRAEFYRDVVLAKLGPSLPRAPLLGSCSFRVLCNWLQKAQVSAAFHEERVDSSTCEVGRVTRVSESSVTVDCVDGAGGYDETREILFCDLTRLDCLGEYERSFDLV